MKSILVILQALWLGAHITVGYVAGELFHVVSYLGLFTAVVWWWFCRSVRQPSPILNALLLLLVVSEWVVTPVIAAIKQQQSQWLHDLVGGSFGMWHGISSTVYLLITVLLLFWTGKRLQINSHRR